MVAASQSGAIDGSPMEPSAHAAVSLTGDEVSIGARISSGIAGAAPGPKYKGPRRPESNVRVGVAKAVECVYVGNASRKRANGPPNRRARCRLREQSVNESRYCWSACRTKVVQRFRGSFPHRMLRRFQVANESFDPIRRYPIP